MIFGVNINAMLVRIGHSIHASNFELRFSSYLCHIVATT